MDTSSDHSTYILTKILSTPFQLEFQNAHIPEEHFQLEPTSLKLKPNHQVQPEIILEYLGQHFQRFAGETFMLAPVHDLNPSSLIYTDDYKQATRVPIHQTKLHRHESLQNHFISNKTFCTKHFSLFLALNEANLRSGYSFNLNSQLNFFNEKSRKQHFRDLYKSLSNCRDSKFVPVLTYCAMLDFSTSEKMSLSMQKVADDYSICFYIYHLKQSNIEVEFRVPHKPKIIPIPKIKLLKYHEFFMVLYSNEECAVDGFSASGDIERAYKQEPIEDSFYFTFNKDSFNLILNDSSFETSQNVLKFLTTKALENKNSRVLEYLSSVLNDLTRSGINQPRKYLQNLLENIEKLNEAKKSLSPDSTPRELEKVKNQSVLESSKSGQNLQILNLKQVSQFIPDKQSPRISKSPTFTSSYVPLPDLQKPRFSVNAQLKPFNSKLTLRENRATSETECPACRLKKQVDFFHGSCKICYSCIAFSVLNEMCINCNSENIKNESKKYMESGFLCTRCKMSKRNIEISTCGCVVCKECCKIGFKDNHEYHNSS